MRPLAILVTGDPVPLARAARGTFSDMIRQTLGAAWSGPWLEVDCRKDEDLDALEEISGLVITGSSASVTERADWMLKTEARLRTAVAEGTPVFGICFGHQMLAQALGGRVEKNSLGRQIGSVAAKLLEDDPLIDSRADPFVVNASHRDVVVELPPGARVVAETPRDRYAAVRFGERTFGVQFHPEFDAETMRAYISERRGVLAEEGFDPDQLVEATVEARPGASVLRRFAEELKG